MNKHLDILKGIDIFRELSYSELETIHSFMKELSISSGKILFSEGDIGEDLYVVVSGKVNIIVHDTAGNEVIMAEIPEGSFLGEMSIIENLPRSATCKATADSIFLRFHVTHFNALMKENPEISEKLLHSMLQITCSRLLNTNTVLSNMVKWEESARIRAITDDFTKLYNRHYLDETLPLQFKKAKHDKKPLTLVMVDLDHFGTINKLYGEDTGDQLIKISAEIFKEEFREKDILVRYGGDEFTFILPDTDSKTGYEICSRVINKLNKHKIKNSIPGKPDKIGASIGLATFPDHANIIEDLLKKTDRALYTAKEAGRNRAAIYGNTIEKEKTMVKSCCNGGPILRGKAQIISIKQRNTIITEIISTIASSDNFLIFGHKKPDQDCLASMVSMALILKQFSKHCYLYIPETIDVVFDFVPNLCNYNAIPILVKEKEIPKNISTLIILDTPKPDMVMGKEETIDLFEDMEIPKIEFDHHLGADSAYNGATPLSFIDESSSTCELLAIFSLKIMADPDISEFFHIQSLFTRSASLALLTGMVGDTNNGRYLSSPKIQWSYTRMSKYLENKLNEFKTDISDSDDFFASAHKNLIQSSKNENDCLEIFFQNEHKISKKVGLIILNQSAIKDMLKDYSESTIVATARNAADSLAEKSKYVGVVVYKEYGKSKNLIQFRARRNSIFKDIDLREVLMKLKIKNGGGHAGAIGFRLDPLTVENIDKITEQVIRTIEDLLNANPLESKTSSLNKKGK